MTPESNDLTVTRILRAPRARIWDAWADPSQFVQWWAPSRVRTVSNKHDLFAGGGFDTTLHLPDGTVMEGGEGCFLEVIEHERIVFTDALRGGWRPNQEAFFSAIITFEDHSDGTEYTATAMHKDDETRQQHKDMGFLTGWSTALAQLAELVER